jgi:hypothetical protein
MPTRLALAFAAALTLYAQSNKELEKIYTADQADRTNMFAMSAEQFANMMKNDEPRRKRVRELIDAGALTTPEDYVRAAFVFQHGASPDDYLMSHVLGIIAAKMDGSGAWIAAASLDRYLLNTGQPGIFGLQLDNVAPFNSNLLTDRLRAALCAPSLAARAKFLELLAKDPKNAADAYPDNPCIQETEKALVGKWLLMRKQPDGQAAQLMLECKLDTDGDAVFRLSGPGIPPRAKVETESGGGSIKIKVNGETFDLTPRGDMITGRYSSASSSGAIVGVR